MGNLKIKKFVMTETLMIRQCAIGIAQGTPSVGIVKVGTKVLLRYAPHDVMTESLQETSSVMTEI